LFEFLYFVFHYLLLINIIEYFFYFVFEIIMINKYTNNCFLGRTRDPFFYIFINYEID